MEVLIHKNATGTGVKVVATTSTTLTITVTHVVVPVISVSPVTPTVGDNVPAGTTVAKVTVTNADGSAFTGTLSISSQTIANEFVLTREGTTNVWDINTNALVPGAATPSITLTASE